MAPAATSAGGAPAGRGGGDEGQLALLYGALIAGLLFLAFAFFTVAQAGTVRGGGQSAADAAALAAAREDRDAFWAGLLDALGRGGSQDGGAGAEDGGDADGSSWRDWLAGTAPLAGDGCGRAGDFAARNRSDLLTCRPMERAGDDGYTVRVRTRFDTGDSVVPGADHRKARATATAVIRPRCGPTGDGADSGDGGDGGDGHPDSVELRCDDGDFTLDPDDETGGPRPSDLFSVVLVE